MKKLLLISCITILSSQVLYATTITAAGSGNWSSPSTWVGGSVPVAGDTVIIPAGITVTFDDYTYSASLDRDEVTTNIPAITVDGELIFSSSSYIYFDNPINITVQSGGTLEDNTGQSDPGDGGEIDLQPNSTITVNSGANYVTLNSPTYFKNATVVGGHAAVKLTNKSGPFAVQASGTSITLPISLYSFEGTYQDPGDVMLQWNTASEINNAYFTLQRSTDENTFSSIATIQGAGTSSMPHQYQYIDQNIFKTGASMLFYRLEQTDFDGNSTYSDVIAVPIKTIATVTKIWPNPGEGNFSLQLNKTPDQQLTVKVYNENGKLVLQNTFQSLDYEIDLSNQAKGMYFLVLQNRAGQEEGKFKLIVQ